MGWRNRLEYTKTPIIANAMSAAESLTGQYIVKQWSVVVVWYSQIRSRGLSFTVSYDNCIGWIIIEVLHHTLCAVYVCTGFVPVQCEQVGVGLLEVGLGGLREGEAE